MARGSRLAAGLWAVAAACLLVVAVVPIVASQPTFTAVTALNAFKTATGVVSEVTAANPLPITGALTANQSVNLAQSAGVNMTSQNAGALDTTLRFLAGTAVANNAGQTTAGTQRVTLSSDTHQATLVQTGTAAAGTGVTLTLPASAGNFHYITHLEITQFAAALLTAAAVPVVCTTTDLPGSLAFSLSAPALAQGGVERVQYVYPWPLKSTTANTATTIVCPNTANVIFRLNAFYTAAP